MSSDELTAGEAEVWRRIGLIIFAFLTIVVASGILLVVLRDIF